MRATAAYPLPAWADACAGRHQHRLPPAPAATCSGSYLPCRRL